MKQYLKYVKPYLFSFIVGPCLMIVEVLGEVLMPYFMSRIINEGVSGRNVPYIIFMGFTMILTALLMMAGGIGGAYFGAKGAISFAADVRRDVFLKIQKFSFANIDKFSTGSLVTRLTNDITQMQNLVNMALRMMLRAPGMLVGAVIMACMMNARLALVILVVVPLLALAIFSIVRVAFPRFDIMQKKLDHVNSGIQEALTNVRVIKSFVRGSYEEEKFARANRDLLDASLSAFRVMILMMPVMTLAMNLTVLAVVWFGGNQVIAGGMLVGDLTAFITYITQILMSLMMLSMVILQSSRAIASAKRVQEVLNEEVDLTDDAAGNKELEADAVEDLKNQNGLQLASYTTKAIPKVLFFNNAKLTDLRVKRAIRKAIDYEKIKRIFGTSESALPREGFVAQGILGFDNTAELTRDLGGARLLLAEAGYSESNKLEFELLVRASGNDSQYADLIRTDLTETGMINVTLAVKGADWQSYYQEGRHTASLASVTSGGYDFEAGYATRYLLTTTNSAMQSAGFLKNPVAHGQIAIENENGQLTEFGAIRQKMAEAQTSSQLVEAVKKYQKYIVENSPCIALLYDVKVQAYSKKVSGVRVDPAFGILNVQGFETLKKEV